MRFLREIPDVAPDEIAVEVPNGGALVFPSTESKHGQGGVDFVRFVRIEDGAELLYWDWGDWERDPRGVMGAILGAVCRGAEKSLKQ